MKRHLLEEVFNPYNMKSTQELYKYDKNELTYYT